LATVSGTLLNATQPNKLDFCSVPSGTVVASTTTDSQGHYSVTLAYGKYTIKVNGGPAVSPAELRVYKPSHTNVDIDGGTYTK